VSGPPAPGASPPGTPGPGTASADPSRGPLQRLRGVDPSSYIVYVGFVGIFLVMSIVLRDDGFLTGQNLVNILLQTAPVTVMAVGAVFVLRDHGLVAGILGGLLTGVVVGLVNGLLVTKLRLPSFLVTLGMMGLCAGLSQRITQLQAIPTIDVSFNGLFGSGSIAGISTLILWSAVFVLGGHYLYRHTRVGAHVLAAGDNVRAARVSGIKVDRIKIGVLVASGVCAAVAGLLYTGRLHGASYTLGSSDLLTVIAAVVIGGTRLFGGRGSVVGALVGSLILGMLNNGLILAGLSDSEQQIVRGLIILIAVALTLREEKS